MINAGLSSDFAQRSRFLLLSRYIVIAGFVECADGAFT